MPMTSITTYPCVEKRSSTRLVRALLLLSLVLVTANGCAPFTNPTASGVPVREVPPELLGKSKEELLPIPLTLLQQKTPEVYRLGPGDVLGVWIEGVLGEAKQPPPVQVPTGGLPPSLGFPMPVRENGTLTLPLVEPVQVTGMSVLEAQDAIRKAYTVTKKILQPGARIIVTLQRPRMYEILVLREDMGSSVSGAGSFGFGGFIGQTRQATGKVVNLPAYQNDVLHALAQTGGLPGFNALNEVIIERKRNRGQKGNPFFPGPEAGNPCPPTSPGLSETTGEGEIIRIPLRLRPGEDLSFKPEDIVLQTGDIVNIRSRANQIFYTGGLMGSAQYLLPRDYDLDVLQAVSFVRGPLFNGGLNQNNLTGATSQGGIGFPTPSQLSVVRRTAGGGQFIIKVDLNRAVQDPRERILVQPGDLLVLQYSLGEAFAQYFTSVFHYNFFGTIVNRRDLTGTATLVGP